MPRSWSLLLVIVSAAAVLAIADARAAGDDGAGSETAGTVPTPDAAAEATRAKLEALAEELAETAQRYGPDAVALQALLLVETIRAGALGPSEVTVVGPSPVQGEDYLELRVLTGLLFDRDGSDQLSRAAEVLGLVAEPVLARMESFEFFPRGLELVFVYGIQDFDEDPHGKADPSLPFEERTLRMTIPSHMLAELSGGELGAAELLRRARLREGTQILHLAD